MERNAQRVLDVFVNGFPLDGPPGEVNGPGAFRSRGMGQVASDQARPFKVLMSGSSVPKVSRRSSLDEVWLGLQTPIRFKSRSANSTSC